MELQGPEINLEIGTPGTRNISTNWNSRDQKYIYKLELQGPEIYLEIGTQGTRKRSRNMELQGPAIDLEYGTPGTRTKIKMYPDS